MFFRAKRGTELKNLICWGAYIRTRKAVTLSTTFITPKGKTNATFKVDHRWSRVGGLLQINDTVRSAILVFEFTECALLDIWGLDIGIPKIQKLQDGNDLTGETTMLSQSHLIPEAFYLPHASALEVDFIACISSPGTFTNGAEINVKKCSYCGRLLPVDPKRLGVLSFHKHNAKKSKHQNECRACKKLRINDSFNPLRTTDQLHESSVITRERKILLREPEILQEIKERTGAGLKSQVWERFNKKCFRCDKSVALDDFQLDHTRPLAYLWPIDNYATCLCSCCNNEKKEKFPVDFYTPQQLEQLSKITGLSLPELKKKEINGPELDRILANIAQFAKEWGTRIFAAIARKIKELRPDVDLLEQLSAADPDEGQRVTRELQDRGPALEDEISFEDAPTVELKT